MKQFIFQNHSIAYRDEGAGEILVIVHGTPTDSSEYQRVIEALSRTVRCIAIDHLGFGESDKPEDGDYSLDAHRARLAALLDHLRIRRFHLLVHDFGGIIGLPLAADDRYDVQSISILNSWIWPLSETEPQMKRQAWMVSAGLLPWLYRHMNFSARYLLKLGWGRRSPLSAQVHGRYIGRFPAARDRSGTIGFLRALFDFENPNWRFHEKSLLLSRQPVQIVWGAADRLLSPRNLERWKQLLPQARIRVMADVGHFVAEEAPAELIAALREFLPAAS